jgi:hypothetical protein
MCQSEYESTPDALRVLMHEVIANIEEAGKTPRLPQAAVAYLQTALKDLRSIESSCPCGTLRLHRATLDHSGRIESFSRLIE